jgi:hypothetical protein
VIRAGVFIGVEQTGGLAKLKDAVAGARNMYEWAVAQGMAPDKYARLITDEGGRKVTPEMIWDAVNALVSGAGVDQLIVYFAGHGVNINRCEHWLLTDAPTRSNAAVNVTGSVEIARYCGIGHVVFISDACRVAPLGIQAQNVRGQDIFPNDDGADRARPVDQFFACMLGRTAAEIADPAQAASTFKALYTTAMRDALLGNVPSILELSTDPADTMRYVKPVKLQEYLETEIPARVVRMKLAGKVNQSPDAILAAHTNWVSRVPPAPATPPRSADQAPVPQPAPSPVTRSLATPLRPKIIESVRDVTRTLVNDAAALGGPALDRAVTTARDASGGDAKRVLNTIERLADPFGPDHFETECGIKVRGRRIVEVVASRVTATRVGTDDTLVRIENLPERAANVVLRFERKCGTVIPALAGFIAALTFEGDELVDVSYEPSANSWRWGMYERVASEVRTLRAIAASAAQHGRFKLHESQAMQIASRMQYAKGIDPTFAVYAAYAYHDLQLPERIRSMGSYLLSDVGVKFFDLALLSRELVGKAVDAQARLFPFTPLLAQGWALLRAHRVRLPQNLENLEQTMLPSLWSLYDDAGVDALKKALS